LDVKDEVEEAKVDAPSVSPPHCPAEHVLTDRMAEGEYECDLCGEDVTEGERFYDCRACDFSMCCKCCGDGEDAGLNNVIEITEPPADGSEQQQPMDTAEAEGGNREDGYEFALRWSTCLCETILQLAHYGWENNDGWAKLELVVRIGNKMWNDRASEGGVMSSREFIGHMKFMLDSDMLRLDETKNRIRISPWMHSKWIGSRTPMSFSVPEVKA
jgi:hypothetical protein